LLILSFDTATDIATACVWRDGDVLAESATHARSVAAQRVLADIDRLMGDTGVAPADLDLVVAGTGPGTFTGLRIGLAAARALGFALGIPVKGVSTLDALRAGDGVGVACGRPG
jgi:tRNA threonylcarbamoyladenosine biosynthesis protein TsaB